MSAICSSEYRRSLSRAACARMRVRWGEDGLIIAPSCPRCSAVRGFTNFVGGFIRTILPENLYPGAYQQHLRKEASKRLAPATDKSGQRGEMGRSSTTDRHEQHVLPTRTLHGAGTDQPARIG